MIHSIIAWDIELILEPEEIPSIPGESTVIVARKITEICNKVDILMEQNF